MAGLRELGYLDGSSIMIERRFAGDNAEKLPALAAELVALRVDVLVASSFQAIAPAMAATKTIPIIFTVNADPVGSGVVASLARPGGNVTGFATLAGDLGAKQIELLRAVVPGLAGVGVLVNPSNAGNGFVIRSMEAGARAAGLSVQTFEAATPEAIDRAFVAMAMAMAAVRVDAVAVVIDGAYVQEAPRIAELAIRHHLPSIAPQRGNAEAGCLMSYGSPLADNYRRAAIYVDKILKGAKPGDLPVEQPTTVELVLNLKTVKALGQSIPQALRLRADRVIE
ncbi:MAG: ABC transporter substrate-binding protein [Burkholderiales bacterium]